MKNNISSAYIHIPFCKNICSYCDFCKVYYDEKLINKYLKALKKEINKTYTNETLKTIYIGGGTPSSLSIEYLQKLFEIISILKIDKKYEFTFECNVNDLTKEKLLFLKNNKVNRLSIGVQSFNKKILNNLGRLEIPSIENINLAKKYFNNINIDLIYGANNETIDDLKDDLNTFISLDITHISIYGLILEDNTALKINGYMQSSDETYRKMYDIIRKILSNNNYIHYEISNFSKKDYESKHNLTYWNNEHYYGFGLGSSSYINNKRINNTRSMTKYLKEEFVKETEILTEKEKMEYEMILNLRKIKGISKQIFKEKYNKEIKEVFNTSRLKENKNYYYIKKSDLYVSNYILCDFVDV